MSASEPPEPLVSRLQELLAEARDPGLSEERRREICGRLGMTARALGLEAEGARYEELAGEGSARVGVTEAENRRPRFSLQLKKLQTAR